MATLLESYTGMKNSFDAGVQTAEACPGQVWAQQEILYRIGVLETCQMFVKAAPQSTDPKDLHWHYQMVDAYFRSLTLERPYGPSAGEPQEKQRDTAHEHLLQVIQGYQKRFCSFAPGNDAGCYRKTIASVIQSVLPVWLQYRQTLIDTKEAGR